MRHLLFAALSALALAATGALAESALQSTPLRATHVWARATAPGAANGGVFMKLENTGTSDDRLLKAGAEVARSVELHTHRMEGGVARMFAVPAIDVPAGKAVELKPGGLHVMLIGLARPLKEGEKFPLTLHFEKAGAQKVEVAVGSAGAASGHLHDK